MYYIWLVGTFRNALKQTHALVEKSFSPNIVDTKYNMFTIGLQTVTVMSEL